MAGLNGGLAANVVKTALDKVLVAEFDYLDTPDIATAMNQGVFKQQTTDRSAVVTEQFMGTGYFQNRSELQDVPQSQVRVGNQKTSTVLNWAQSLDISKNLFDDDQHSVVASAITNMGRNARVTRDKEAFAMYNNGFTTQLTNDGVALFSNSHVTLLGDTVDNLETGAFSAANLEAAWVSLLQQKTQDGTLGGHNMNVLLVPPVLFPDAQEVTGSELQPGTAQNNLNWVSKIYPGLMVKQSPFLSAGYGGSNTAWFLMSRNHFITRFERQGLQTSMIDWQYQRNNNYVYKAEYREVYDTLSYEGSLGSNGTV